MLGTLLGAVVVILGCLIISIVVFGGAQIFIPYFKILLVNLLGVSPDVWNSVLSITNATPGVFGLKLAFISGFLAANGNWWGWLLMIVTYIAFIMVPIGLILLIFNKYKKIKETKFMIAFSKMMKPLIGGILCSIIINLFISILLPFVGFNDLSDNINNLDKYLYIKTDQFFTGWRFWMIFAWTLISIPVEYWIMKKYKINTIFIIIINIILSFFNNCVKFTPKEML